MDATQTVAGKIGDLVILTALEPEGPDGGALPLLPLIPEAFEISEIPPRSGFVVG